MMTFLTLLTLTGLVAQMFLAFFYRPFSARSLQ